MKRFGAYLVFVISLFLTMAVFSCSDSEHRLGLTKQTATVVLNLGVPEEHALIPKSLFDRMFSFFMRDAVAQTAPAAFSSVTVLVTGPDISPIEQSFTSGNSISFTVPAGNLRQFQVIANVDPADPGAALSFQGIAVSNLPAGVTVNVPVVMMLHETKIVIPDPFDNVTYTNRRLIQINDMTGAGWIEKQGSDIGFSGTFFPWAVDFDARGRIYIANNNGVSGSDVIIRINNMNDTACITLGNGSNNGINSVAVDRINNYVYYSTDSILSLKRCNLDGTGDVSLTIPSSISSINGLTVGPDGKLYIVGINTFGNGAVYQYDPEKRTETASYSGLVTPFDVEVRAPYIYIADAGDGYTNKIVQLNGSLDFVAGYGNWVDPPVINKSPGMFYGPRRFLGIRNDTLIIIDDYSATTDLDKLVSLKGMSDAGWNTYGNEGKGTGQFQFFYGC